MPYGYHLLTKSKSILVNRANGMWDLGKILSLKNLAASVKVNSSFFPQLLEPYNGCTNLGTSPVESLNNFRQLFNADKKADTY